MPTPSESTEPTANRSATVPNTCVSSAGVPIAIGTLAAGLAVVIGLSGCGASNSSQATATTAPHPDGSDRPGRRHRTGALTTTTVTAAASSTTVQGPIRAAGRLPGRATERRHPSPAPIRPGANRQPSNGYKIAHHLRRLGVVASESRAWSPTTICRDGNAYANEVKDLTELQATRLAYRPDASRIDFGKSGSWRQAADTLARLTGTMRIEVAWFLGGIVHRRLQPQTDIDARHADGGPVRPTLQSATPADRLRRLARPRQPTASSASRRQPTPPAGWHHSAWSMGK